MSINPTRTYNAHPYAYAYRSTVATTVQFAVACGLHDPNTMHSANVMLPPADEIDVSDRRNLWYGIALCDNCLSFGNGLPRAAPEKVRVIPTSRSISSANMVLPRFMRVAWHFRPLAPS